MNYGPDDYRAIVDSTSIYSDLQEASGFDGVIEYHVQDSSDLYRPSYAGTVLNPSTAERITSICLRRIRSTDWGSFR